MSSNFFEAICFDMDGVILNSMHCHAKTWQALFKEKGLKVSPQFILENEGALGIEVLMRLFEQNGKKLESDTATDYMKQLLDQQSEIYLKQYAGKVATYPGVLDFLTFLKDTDKKAALVTSSRMALVKKSLPDDIFSGFSAMVTAEDVAKHKPHPDPYLKATQALGIKPEKCIVVENAPAGIQSALSAGALCYAVSTTLPSSYLKRANCVFPDLWSLMRYLGWSE